MNEQTEASPPKRLEEAPGDFCSPTCIERPEDRVWRPEKPEDLPGQDLRNADLKGCPWLLPEHLARSDLTGNRTLPDDIAKFPALEQVAAISSEARKIFIGLLAACVYSWLVIGTTTDVALILNTVSSPLPIINTPIPIAGFYVVGAALLSAVYCYLHFYLHRLWRVLATLPAVFPDGMALDDKSDPWLLNNLVRVYFERLKPDRHPLKRLETSLSIALAWVLVPFTLFALWVRYLPSHGWLGSYWLVILTGFTMIIGWHFFRFARAALSGETPPSSGPGLRGTWRELHALSWKARIFWSLAVVVPLILVACTEAAFRIDPHDDRSWAARGLMGLRVLGIRTYADLREVNVAEPPDGWNANDWSKIKRVDLRDRNLAFADASGAFLANADLRGANLWRAHFPGADLRGAALQGANLQGADFSAAQLQNAVLNEAVLRGANLLLAKLEGANLQGARLQGANLQWANLEAADLSQAQLQGAYAREVRLQAANLLLANFQGADLVGAQLQGADLSRTNLQGADLRGVALWRAVVRDAEWDLADLRASDVSPMTEGDVDATIARVSATIADEDQRNSVLKELMGIFSASDRQARPEFPDQWQSQPNVMFEPGDPEPEPLDWGERKWASNGAYDEDLGRFLSDLACGQNVPEGQTQGITRRALAVASGPRLLFPDPSDRMRLAWTEPDRLWHQRFAASLIGPDCPPAERLPDDMKWWLEQLAAQVHVPAVPETSPHNEAE